MMIADSYSTGYKAQIWDWSLSGGNLTAFDHSNRANIGWSDGHVSSMSSEEVGEEFRKAKADFTFDYAQDDKVLTYPKN